MINLESWTITGAKIIGYILGTIALLIITQRFFSRLIIKILDHKYKDQAKLEAKRKTILGVINNATRFIFIIIALLMILSEFNVNIAPLLAGAGVVGFAISFASQNLIKDFISGIFILIENQFEIGDKIQVGPPVNQEGEVVDFTLRKTIIKNDEGAVIFVSNSQISYLINKSKKINNDKGGL